ncbi:TrpS [Desulforapulum autotrophicum HRM2]|uniref:Tryptophan--tRNA ligase n=1 Tax=Desulforapulum autotrophicum (strain ATCC 43914 / DSM 3382 / VKM B-1955 / HRM2) TaxID=177437 RepID=C0QEI6_DESAH|nr:tryptophan--tRNA ligase [Desulforapulum autotrophicum]ACN15328.1 TrpS [Desulforapulum autotrophicum HRM2]
MKKSADLLTGITTTGTPHLGNYVGAIRPAIDASKEANKTSYYFLADYHAIIKCQDPERIRRSVVEVAATWLAMGLDTDRSIFYRQTDIPEIPELSWILSCMTSKGLMNRAHAYKASVADNEARGKKDLDKDITMGLFSYPVLMAADILMFNARKVPVGSDQIQHLEMARDIAGRFNNTYGTLFEFPEAVVDEKTAVLAGLDGRKMSKSYNNTIPLFEPEKRLRKLIMKIKTNSLEPEEPKDPATCTLFAIYKAFATPEEVQQLETRYLNGIAWGTVKQELFEYLNELLREPRKIYNELVESPGDMDAILKKGALRAREYATPFLEKIRSAIGIQRL